MRGRSYAPWPALERASRADAFPMRKSGVAPAAFLRQRQPHLSAGTPPALRFRGNVARVPASEDVVAGVRLLRDGAALGRDAAEAAGLVVLERLDQLVPGVHHEGAIGGHGLPDRLTAQDEDVQFAAGALLRAGGRDGDHVTGAERGQL